MHGHGSAMHSPCRSRRRRAAVLIQKCPGMQRLQPGWGQAGVALQALTRSQDHMGHHSLVELKSG